MTTNNICTNFGSASWGCNVPTKNHWTQNGKSLTEGHLTSPEAVVLVLAHPADAAISPVPSVAALLLLVL